MMAYDRRYVVFEILMAIHNYFHSTFLVDI